MIATFDQFTELPRWVAWRNEKRGDRTTKVPHSPHGGPAKADDPRTWGSRSEAEARARRVVNGEGGGIGIELGDLGDETSLGGIDLDTCRREDGTFEEWAREIIERFDSYAETSPSGTGAKIFFRYPTDDLAALREAMGGPQHGREFKRGNGKDHPPAIELHLSNRYFTVTEQKLDGVPDVIRAVPTDLLLWVLREAGPDFTGVGKSTANGNRSSRDTSRSAKAFRIGIALVQTGATYEEMVDALLTDPETADWVRTKGQANGGRELCRIWEKASGETIDRDRSGVLLSDFYAYMPMHNYIYVPVRALWPAASVNARIPPVPLTDPRGNPVLDEDGKAIKLRASAWLDQFRAVEQMTWAPGLPIVIRDKLVLEGGWIERRGVTCFNLYRAPIIEPGDPEKAAPWINHVRLIYPDEADHIIDWLAHRVQRPQEKINHALVLGGQQGIGKDTLLEPVKYAIGPWNLHEVSPKQVLGRFNGFLKAVILRISEARDLGEFDRFQFYDHMKSYTASPPDTLRIDEKNLREYAILNCCGVIITTNHKTDGIFLPADDRRHFVAWSGRTKDDPEFQNGYWQSLYVWYHARGMRDVAAFLMRRDISGFDPKAPPPKTPAFWAIVDANRASEESELADILDRLGNPSAVTLSHLVSMAEGDITDWLRDRRNRRIIPHRLEQCGYVPVLNPGDARDGQWKINGTRQTVYARQTLSLRDQIAAAEALRLGWRR